MKLFLAKINSVLSVVGTETSVSWFKDGKPLKTGDGITISQDGDKFTIEVAKCSAESAGEYTCTASNCSGSACCTANVIVAGQCTIGCLFSSLRKLIITAISHLFNIPRNCVLTVTCHRNLGTCRNNFRKLFEQISVIKYSCQYSAFLLY